MSNFWPILRALWMGAKLRKSSSWKNRGAFLAIFVPFAVLCSKVAVAYGWIPAEVSQQEIEEIAQWIWQGYGLLLAYWFRATSDEVGWGGGQEIEEHPDVEQEYDYGAPAGGVLNQQPRLRLPPVAKTNHHPGDDPGLDDFNR